MDVPATESQGDMSDVADIVGSIDRSRDELGRVAVGISGYAGAGKSVLARRLVDELDDAVRLPGDDYLDPPRVHRRSADWDGVDRHRMRTDALEPFREGRPVTIQPLDWSTGQLGDPTPLPRASVLIVDGIGIFHPTLLPWFDLTVWVDAALDVAQAQGMARDRAAGRDHDTLWIDVWTPNDHEFEQMFAPADQADFRYVS
jgi:uridine kinase